MIVKFSANALQDKRGRVANFLSPNIETHHKENILQITRYKIVANSVHDV